MRWPWTKPSPKQGPKLETVITTKLTETEDEALNAQAQALRNQTAIMDALIQLLSPSSSKPEVQEYINQQQAMALACEVGHSRAIIHSLHNYRLKNR